MTAAHLKNVLFLVADPWRGDTLGLAVPRQCDGASLLPRVGGSGPGPGRDCTHLELDFRDHPGRAVPAALGYSAADDERCKLAAIRDGRFKYVHFPSLPPLLLDLEASPDEAVDRAGDPAYASTLAEYAGRMLDWRLGFEAREQTHLGQVYGEPMRDMLRPDRPGI